MTTDIQFPNLWINLMAKNTKGEWSIKNTWQLCAKSAILEKINYSMYENVSVVTKQINI